MVMDAQYVPGTVPGKILSTTDTVTLTLIAVMVVGGTGVAFIESFDGLHQWALGHGLKGWRADIWPFQIDAFIAVGEATLLVATLRRWDWRSKILAGLVALGGAAISIAANIGHVGTEVERSWHLTAAVPPFIAFVGLMIGLGILKRVIRDAEKVRAGAAAWHLAQTGTGTAYQAAPALAPEPIAIPSLDVQADRAMAPAQDVPQLLPAGASVPERATDDVPERATEDVPGAAPAPAQVPARPADVPPVPRPREGDSDYVNHEKWDAGVKLYRESVETPGAALSQRKLAEALGMRNRSLAAAIIKHVKDEIKNETVKEEKTDDVIDRVLQAPEATA